MCKIANCHILYNDSAMIHEQNVLSIYQKFWERKVHCTKANECIDCTTIALVIFLSEIIVKKDYF